MVTFAIAMLLSMAGFGFDDGNDEEVQHHTAYNGFGVGDSVFDPWDDEGFYFDEDWDSDSDGYVGIQPLMSSPDDIEFVIRSIQRPLEPRANLRPGDIIRLDGNTYPNFVEAGEVATHTVYALPGFSLYSWTQTFSYFLDVSINVLDQRIDNIFTTDSRQSVREYYSVSFLNSTAYLNNPRAVHANFVELNVKLSDHENDTFVNYDYMDYKERFIIENMRATLFPNLPFEAVYLELSNSDFFFMVNRGGEWEQHDSIFINGFRGNQFNYIYINDISVPHNAIFIAPVTDLDVGEYSVDVVIRTERGTATLYSEITNDVIEYGTQRVWKFEDVYVFTVSARYHDVIFDLNGGHINGYTDYYVVEEVLHGDELGERVPENPERDGYVFVAWEDDENDYFFYMPDDLDDLEGLEIKRSRVFVAVWAPVCACSGTTGPCTCGENCPCPGNEDGDCNCRETGNGGPCNCQNPENGGNNCGCDGNGNNCDCPNGDCNCGNQGPCECLTGGGNCGCEGNGSQCPCADCNCNNGSGHGVGNNESQNNSGQGGTGQGSGSGNNSGWNHPGTSTASSPSSTTPESTTTWNPVTRPPRPQPLPVPTPPADAQGRHTHRWFIQGYPEGDVRADGFMTRAEMAAMFFNLSDSPDKLTAFYNANFPDVRQGDWHFRAINYAAVRHGALSGFPDGRFRPNQHITFAEFAAFATGFFNLRQHATRAVFADPFDHWAAEFLAYSFDPTWFGYFGQGFTLIPDAPIPRSIAVTLVNHYTGRVPNRAEITNFLQGRNIYTDVRSHNHWAFYEIMTASITHTFTHDDNGNQAWDRRDGWWLTADRNLLGNWWFLGR